MAKILIVDDSTTMRQQLSITLGKDYEVIEATDGEDGIKKLDSNLDIGLVFLDVNMPNLGGLEMLEQLHQGGKHKDIPVIMLTTEVDRGKITRAKAAGAKGWIVKPFEPQQVLAIAKKMARP